MLSGALVDDLEAGQFLPFVLKHDGAVEAGAVHGSATYTMSV